MRSDVQEKPLTLAEARQRVADRQARVAELRAMAAAGEPVPGADLAAAVADVEVAEAAVPALERAEAERQEAERREALQREVDAYQREIPALLAEFRAAVEAFWTAMANLRLAGAAANARTAHLIALAGQGASIGDPVKSVIGGVAILGPGGYERVETIPVGAWLDRLCAEADTGDLYPQMIVEDGNGQV